jgi:ATP-dependent DNA helicase RecG
MISNKTAKELIDELNLLDESDAIEAKEVSGAVIGDSIYETICAFSNEPTLDGGVILLGVKRDSSQLFSLYTVSGIKQPDKLSGDIVSACQNMFNVSVRPNIKRELVDRKVVLRVEIDELQPAQKPLYIKRYGLPRGAFRRIGGADVRCTHDDIAAIYQDGVAKTYDEHVVANSHITDLDPATISLYRQFVSEFNPSSEILRWRDKDLLIGTTSLIDLDGKVRATAAGILTFGKATSLRRFFPAIRADYLRVPGKHWVSDPENRFVSTEMRGPTITIIDRIIAAISDDLPKRFRLDDANSARRKDDPIIPNKAIREAVVNAVMHRNYNVARPIQVIRFSNRLVIENPGYSLKSEEQFDSAGSVIRNPHIAAFLHETHFAETKGSGMRVMRELLRQSGLSAPTFESDRDNDTFRVTFLFHHLLDPREWEWLQNYATLKLSQEELTALAYVKETSHISNLNFRAITGLETLAASKSLRKLCECKLLEKKGGGAQTYYVSGPEMLKYVEIEPEAALHDKESALHHKGATLHDKGPDPEARFPLNLKKKLLHHRMGRRSEPEAVRSMIVEICQYGPLSKEAIASLLDREPGYVAQNYLSPLLKEGMIMMTIPDMPSHPEQKYKAESDNAG